MRVLLRHFVSIGALLLVSLPFSRASIVTAATESTPRISVLEQPFLVTSSTRGRFVFQLPEGIATRNTTLDVRVHRRLASRTSFQSIANEEVEAAVIDTFSVPVRQLSLLDNQGYLVTIPFSSSAKSASSLTVPFEGVYPVSLVLRRKPADPPLAKALTFIHKRDTDSKVPKVASTVAVRLAPTISTQPDGTLTITDTARAEVQEFISFISSYNSSLTISVQPEIVYALSLSTDPRDIALLTQLQSLLRTRTITTSTFAALDPSLFAAIGRGQEFIEQLRFGEATLNRVLPGVPIQRGAWWVTHPLSNAGVSLLRTAGIVSLVLSPAAQRGVNTESPLGVLSRPDGTNSEFMSVVSVDAGVTQTMSQHNDAISAYRAVAELIMERDDLLAQGRSPETLRLVLSTPSGSLDTNGALAKAARLLAGLTATDMAAPQSVNAQTPAIDFPATTNHGGESRAAGIAVARTELLATASMTDEADSRRTLWQSLLSLGESSAVSDPNEYIAGLRAQLAATRRAVSVTTPNSITLSGREGVIRFQLRNDSQQPLSVKVRMASVKLRLSEPIRVVALAAGSTTEVEVVAGTRTNGRFPISVRVTTPTGNLEVIPYISITAKVNAIAGLGQLVSISLLLIILAWWWSHWRRARLKAAEATTVSVQ